MSTHDHNSIFKAKMQSKRLAEVYWRWGKDADSDTIKARSIRVDQCSTYWTGVMCPCCGHMAHMHTYGCGDRLCPLCAARKSRATAAQAMAVTPQLTGKPLLLTLTVENVPAGELNATLDKMLQGWAAVRHLRRIKRSITAWARSLEVTYRPWRDDYHPHIHAIIYVTDDRLSRADFWGEVWREAMQLDYHPIIDVRPITNTLGSIYEVSKYATKVAAMLSLPDELVDGVVRTMSMAIHKRRLKSYGGEWAKVRRRMRMVDVDQLDDGTIDTLAAQLDDEKCCGSPMVPITMVWAGMDYVITKGAGRSDGN